MSTMTPEIRKFLNDRADAWVNDDEDDEVIIPPCTWIYVQSEPGLFTVGFYDHQGKWNSDSDHSVREDAAKRVHYLNGGGK